MMMEHESNSVDPTTSQNCHKDEVGWKIVWKVGVRCLTQRQVIERGKGLLYDGRNRKKIHVPKTSTVP